MRLASFIESGQSVLGLVQGEQLLNLTAVSAHFTDATQNDGHFTDMALLLSANNGSRETVLSLAAWAKENGPTQFSIPLADAEYAVPLANPGKIICVGLNYADHCRETNTPLPSSPILFNKFTSSLLPHGGEITWSPKVTQQVDYEAELAIIIGKTARFVNEADAMDYIAGYTILNDISARDVQFSDGQ